MEENFDTSAVENDRNRFSFEKGSRVGGPVTCVAFSPSDASTKMDGRPRSLFSFVAQGPFLVRYENSLSGQSDAGRPDTENRAAQTKKQKQLLVFPEDVRRKRGGGTIHGLHFLHQEKHSSTSFDTIVYGAKRLAFCSLLGTQIGRYNVEHVVEQNSEKDMHASISKNGDSLSRSPFMEMDDWIWTVKTLSIKSSDKHLIQSRTGRDPSETILNMVVGYARHMIELWNVKESIIGTKDTIYSTRLRRLFLSPPTVVTSMDFIFLNEQNQHNYQCAKEEQTEVDTLQIAAGTSFHKIWISSIPIGDLFISNTKPEEGRDSASASTIESSEFHHLLKGHSGVVHSVKWFQDCNRVSLASTSDDRSVRKWDWDVAQKQWVETWVGWGHSARVWSVSSLHSTILASDSSALSPSPSSSSPPLLVSVAEDGTARIWSSNSGETLALIHHSSTLWTIDTRNTADGGVFITGGTDGTSAIYHVCNYIFDANMLTNHDIPVPDDRSPVTTSSDSMRDTTESQKSDGAITKKQKKSKKKKQAQVIVGMKCWRDNSSSRVPAVIVATRQGSLMSYSITERIWNSLNPWWNPSVEDKFGIIANNGNSMAVCDGVRTVAIGTTRGDIILSSLLPERKNNTTILNARKLRAVQGLSFLKPSCLVSFHVQSVALWLIDFSEFPTTMVPEPTYILKVETKGIPQSCAFDQNNQRVVVGDSRGNLVYFRINQIDFLEDQNIYIINPASVAHRVHQKQHVTSIKWLNNYTILSAGNDGCLHVSYLNGDSLQKGWSYPAPSLTGINRIMSSSETTVVAGYHGNTYRVIDTDSGYEYIRCDTGGRQRILDCCFSFKDEQIPPEYQLVVCKAQKDGSNHLFVQHSKQQSTYIVSEGHSHLTQGVQLHGETIFDSVFFTLTNQEVVFLVTASEDCSSRISAWKDGQILDSVLLTPQESCCRCLTVSQIDSRSALLVVGGGKLALQFFLVKDHMSGARQDSAKNLEITYIGNGLVSKKGATIDHRINSINAVPFVNGEDRSHFVIAGDSEGKSHAFKVSEANHQSYRNLLGRLAPTKGERPILCVEALLLGDRILILMGTTGGEIELFDLPASLCRPRGCWDEFEDMWNPIGTYNAHQMGTNTICAEVVSLETRNGGTRATISIVSGGDDQALCVSHVSLDQKDESSTRLQLTSAPQIRIIREASFSAIKGVSCIRSNGRKYLISVGYSQQLSIWRFNVDDGMLLECISRLPVDLGDVNCLSVFQTSDESTSLVAVCGMGVEMFRKGNADIFT